MQNRRIALFAFIFAAVLVVPNRVSSEGLGIEVTPAKLEVQIGPAASYNIPVTVRNSSSDSTHVQATMVDFGVSTNGSYEFGRVGARPFSLMKYAAIRPREFDLPAGTTQQVQLTIVMPNDSKLSGEYAGIVFFQTRPIRRAGSNVAFSARVASKIYEAIPGSVKIDGAITKMVSAKSGRGQVYRVSFKNTGNVHVYLRGQVTIQKSGQVVDQVAMENGMLVERGGDRIVEVTGKKLPPGQYQAIATMDYGGQTETGGEIQFSVER